MGEVPPKKPDWAIPFLTRLCLIGWVCAILYEAFDFLRPVRQLCLLFGPWACIIALLNAVTLLLIRRRGIFLFFILVALPPAVHFGFILRNIAIEKKLIQSHETAPEPATGHDADPVPR
jgi:hypothetical protein